MSEPIEFYPGTSKPIGAPADKAPSESENEALYAKPRTGYQVNGQPFPCYAIGVLARAMKREVVTIRLWEREGLLPRTTFSSSRIQGGGKARLYTREQIQGVVKIAKEEGVYERNSKISVRDTKFTERVAQLFREIEAQYRSKR